MRQEDAGEGGVFMSSTQKSFVVFCLFFLRQFQTHPMCADVWKGCEIKAT